MKVVLTVAKALVSGATAFAGSVATGYTDGNMTSAEWWTSVGVGLAALSLVWGVPNAKGSQNE